jgi:hypothetical protein
MLCCEKKETRIIAIPVTTISAIPSRTATNAFCELSDLLRRNKNPIKTHDGYGKEIL